MGDPPPGKGVGEGVNTPGGVVSGFGIVGHGGLLWSSCFVVPLLYSHDHKLCQELILSIHCGLCHNSKENPRLPGGLLLTYLLLIRAT